MGTEGTTPETGGGVVGVVVEGRQGSGGNQAAGGSAGERPPVLRAVSAGEPAAAGPDERDWFVQLGRAVSGHNRVQVYRDLPPNARGYCGTIYLASPDPEQLLNQVESLYGGGRYRIRPLTTGGEFAPGSCMVDLPGPPKVNPQNWSAPAPSASPNYPPAYPYQYPPAPANPDIVSALSNLVANLATKSSHDPQAQVELAQVKAQLEVLKQGGNVVTQQMPNDPFAGLDNALMLLKKLEAFKESVAPEKSEEFSPESMAAMLGGKVGMGLPTMPKNSEEAMWQFLGMMMQRQAREPQIIQTQMGPMQTVTDPNGMSFLAPLGWVPGAPIPRMQNPQPQTQPRAQPQAQPSQRPTEPASSPVATGPARAESPQPTESEEEGEEEGDEDEGDYTPGEMAEFLADIAREQGITGLAQYLSQTMDQLPDDVRQQMQALAAVKGAG